MRAKTFTDEFKARLAAIEAEAAELGETWSSICRETGIGRATPVRWRRSVPTTIELVDRVETHLRERRKALVQAALVSPGKHP